MPRGTVVTVIVEPPSFEILNSVEEVWAMSCVEDDAVARVGWQVRRSIDRYHHGETSLNFLAVSLDKVASFAEGRGLECAHELRGLWVEIETINAVVLSAPSEFPPGDPWESALEELLNRLLRAAAE
jgi:hypothetical protein